VMTRDLLHDLPPTTFRLTIAGVSGLNRGVRLSDPLTGRSVDVHVASRRGSRLVVDLPLTDSPRLLVLS